MDKREIRARAIGLLTASYAAYGKGGNSEGFAEMVDPLLNNLLSSSINLELKDTRDMGAVARTISAQVTKELEPGITTLLVTLIAAFIALSREYEAACPDADVPRVIQDFAIRGQGFTGTD